MSYRESTINRQKAIKELIKKFAISDQKQLMELLLQECALETNQAVISRDLRKLGVVKKAINGAPIYEMPDIDVTTEILRLAIVEIQHNESMIVIETHPGLADFVGDCVDQYADLEILGCLAGENVLFITPKSIKNIKNTYELICKKLHFKQNK